MTSVSSWGRLGAEPHDLVRLDAPERVAQQIGRNLPGIAFGNGRSYGDVCLNPGGALWSTRALDKFIAFDERTGILQCEAGVLLRDIQRLLIPRGWALAVTPGTQLVTVGGAIANDVHGKNHHVAGSFGDHVRSLHLVRTDGSEIDCGPAHAPDWFAATVGGLGLTGVIVHCALQLRPTAGPWLDAETIPYRNLGEFFQLAADSEAEWEQTVSWFDCIGEGRGIFMRARPAADQTGRWEEGRKLAIPAVPPISLVNKLSLKPFNELYFQLKRRSAGRSRVHYEPFSYPLDNVLEWNRIYGPRGFYQHQSVVPPAEGEAAITAMLAAIRRAGEGSFLAVLKTFGDRAARGLLSFPRPGVTLALDFPNKGEKTLRLLSTLDDIVRGARGRIYAAKDARMPRDLFESGYPQLDTFRPFRDPGISSGLSRRLLGS